MNQCKDCKHIHRSWLEKIFFIWSVAKCKKFLNQIQGYRPCDWVRGTECDLFEAKKGAKK